MDQAITIFRCLELDDFGAVLIPDGHAGITGNATDVHDPLAIDGHVVDEEERRALELGAADNMKRVRLETSEDLDYFNTEKRHSPWTIEPFTERKTIWHPSGA